MVTTVPNVPALGVNELTTGGCITVMIAVLIPVPFGLVALTTPVVAPAGIVVVMVVSLTTV